MHIDLVVGARPNFMKAAPLAELLRERRPDWLTRVIHTGQHYDEKLSQVFFRQLGMRQPDVNLEVGSASHTYQTATIMLALEGQFRASRPDLVMVFGDVNSTLAAALVAVQLHIPLAHVEAGLRSFDRGLPEEVNRVLTDTVSELLFVTERAAELNLRNEGIPSERIHFVGNTMIDSLVKHRPAARALHVTEALGLRPREYVVVTLHKPINVDEEDQLRSIVYALQSLADHTDVVFPAHPRTVQRLKVFGLWDDMDRHGRLRVLNPLGYLEFMGLLDSAGVVLTDSGGVQEEALVLGVPCVTLRKTTERPVTLQMGANRLAGDDPHLAVRYVREALSSPSCMNGDRAHCPPPVPEGWDGHAADRIVDVLEGLFVNHLVPENVASARGASASAPSVDPATTG
ncbi:MAG TPA: UDP-N-acetylglucosamine 2-epimerase (non-hydrolyzing) [Vicinamibacterales bacterium]|nr:UDP-N-acetylglucosamine 2-epimerase (non-hydrolyzing) [Vicinamibacterales bacterium]